MSWNLDSDQSPLPACGLHPSSPLLPSQLSPQLRVPVGSTDSSQDWTQLRQSSALGLGQPTNSEQGHSTPTCRRWSSILGTSSFLENLWGFLHDASLPTRTKAGWLEREGKCEFPASGQLQITHLWFPETSICEHLFLLRKKKKSPQEEGGVKRYGDEWQDFSLLTCPFYLTLTCPILQISTGCLLPDLRVPPPHLALSQHSGFSHHLT